MLFFEAKAYSTDIATVVGNNQLTTSFRVHQMDFKRVKATQIDNFTIHFNNTSTFSTSHWDIYMISEIPMIVGWLLATYIPINNHRIVQESRIY
jgi:hypothetical protein